MIESNDEEVGECTRNDPKAVLRSQKKFSERVFTENL